MTFRSKENKKINYISKHIFMVLTFFCHFKKLKQFLKVKIDNN